MSACPQCGTVAKPTDKFCNVCGAPIGAAPAGAPPAGYGQQGQPQQQGYGAPAQAPGGFGAPPPAFGAPPPFGAPPQPGPGSPPRCQMGHDIASGASYCPQGHPIALDQMQFAGGGIPGGQQFGAPPPPPPAFGAPPQASPYGAPPPQQSFGGPPQQQGFPQQPALQQGFGAPPPQQPQQQGGFGGPPQQQPQQGYAPPPQAGSYAPPPAYGAPQQQQGLTGGEGAPAKILRGFLVSYGSNASGDFWPLMGGRVAVGRLAAPDGIDISLQDPTISSRHGAFNVDPSSGVIAVEDTGSTNGTFVNDEHIGFNGRRELRDGDRVRFGGFTTVVKVIGRV